MSSAHAAFYRRAQLGGAGAFAIRFRPKVHGLCVFIEMKERVRVPLTDTGRQASTSLLGCFTPPPTFQCLYNIQYLLFNQNQKVRLGIKQINQGLKKSHRMVQCHKGIP